MIKKSTQAGELTGDELQTALIPIKYLCFYDFNGLNGEENAMPCHASDFRSSCLA